MNLADSIAERLQQAQQFAAKGLFEPFLAACSDIATQASESAATEQSLGRLYCAGEKIR